jgi:hypothetical protein
MGHIQITPLLITNHFYKAAVCTPDRKKQERPINVSATRRYKTASSLLLSEVSLAWYVKPIPKFTSLCMELTRMISNARCVATKMNLSHTCSFISNFHGVFESAWLNYRVS